ncbi:MAG: nucleoside deaminase [Bacteroidales bacterium]|nr:nucleoside deaminase [Bacteroidales bacterium]
MNKYMQLAIDEARYGIRGGYGGPFGAVVVRDGVVIGRGHNRVLGTHDPTAHGEVQAIRDATARLGTHDLTGCDIYTTGEPCHMCLCACLWANIRRVYYGCTIKDNALIGFRDDHFNDLFAGRDKLGDYLVEMDRDACLELFDEYRNMPHEKY